VENPMILTDYMAVSKGLNIDKSHT
jgi:hypothetical protein